MNYVVELPSLPACLALPLTLSVFPLLVSLLLASLAMGEKRPAMMGTPGFMPLEVMCEEVITHPSQDVFAMGVMALLVCMSPDKASANLFVSPVRERQTHTQRERDREIEMKAL